MFRKLLGQYLGHDLKNKKSTESVRKFGCGQGLIFTKRKLNINRENYILLCEGCQVFYQEQKTSF